MDGKLDRQVAVIQTLTDLFHTAFPVVLVDERLESGDRGERHPPGFFLDNLIIDHRIHL